MEQKPVGSGDLLALLLLERPDWHQTSVPEYFSFFVCAIGSSVYPALLYILCSGCENESGYCLLFLGCHLTARRNVLRWICCHGGAISRRLVGLIDSLANFSGNGATKPLCIPGANVEPSRRREWGRCWFEFVVLKPVVLRRLVLPLAILSK